jgi:hypothetical protein
MLIVSCSLYALVSWSWSNGFELTPSSGLEQSASKSNEFSNLSIKPNPAMTRMVFQINIPESENSARLKIYNASGRLVYTSHVERRTVYGWDTSDRPAGVYLARLVCGDKVLSRKFVIIK